MADLNLIRELADAAFEDWKDELPGWDWQWNTNVSRLGCCKYTRKTIFLSVHWMKKVDDDEAIDTLLHELAHAIAWERYGMAGHGHGPLWKEVCRELGAVPERMASTSVSLKDLDVVPKWVVKCRSCGTTTPFHRKPKYDVQERYSCAACKGKHTLTLIQNR